ncbi:hypothetical protein J2Z40_000375 [Cytobacillus eiseniae]|uniref:DUF4350 domain-containing protein n=1 Tax=Cytobacillus eiseniae TaxID=762947 RepID=A0ABS4RD95_9BACI|nr:DUF4350 domain-containing protein [Cytobacillus eiseniae]MBP2239822.1 hypothetical protein [Cytobacillus eiseniae]
MEHSRIRKRAWIWISVLLMIFIIISYYTSTQQPKPYPNYVSDSPSPTGIKAFYTYVKENNIGKQWSHSPEKLSIGMKNRLLIMIEPFFIPNKEDMQAYIDFMKSGNTILLFHQNPKGMFDLEIEHATLDNAFEDGVRILNQIGASYSAEINSGIRLQTKNQDKRLIEDDAGTIAFKRSFGDGYLIVSNSPEWLRNDRILANDHLSLVLALINESSSSTILIDEYIHGLQNEATFMTVYPKWFLILLLQGILLAILWLWHVGKRFGPIFIPREESVRYSDEGILALSAWYLRGRLYHESLLIQADYIKYLLQDKWGIPYSKEWQDVSEHIVRRWTNVPASNVHSFIKGLHMILQKEKINKQEYLQWSKKLDRLRKEVEES